jgi:hypothetical protein
MLIDSFVSRAVIVDDKPEEIKGLLDELCKVEIACEVYQPSEFDKLNFQKNRELFFFDLFLNEQDGNEDPKGQISTIRSKLKKGLGFNGGVYGIVLWTSHPNYLIDFKTALSKDKIKNLYNTPLFIVCMNKQTYLRNGYGNFLKDLNQEIEKDLAAYFFMSWGASLTRARDLAIMDVYKHTSDYNNQSKQLLNLLYLLARNHTGIPEKELVNYNELSSDAYKSFDDMLYSDLINSQNSEIKDIFEGHTYQKPQDLEEEIKQYSFINSKLFIDSVNISQEKVIPGNVYEIINPKQYQLIDGATKNSKKIVIELTPPCDYSHKKRLSRYVAGFMCQCPVEQKTLYKTLQSLKGDYKYLLWPVQFEDNNYIVVFDFRYLHYIPDDEIVENNKYKVLYRTQHRIFADIIQKFSSHSARLGNNLLSPVVENPEDKKG